MLDPSSQKVSPKARLAKGRKGRTCLVLLAVIAGIATVFRHQGPDLERYTSPPISQADGQTIRIQLRIPSGWHIRPPEVRLPGAYEMLFSAVPPKPLAWIPVLGDRLASWQTEPGVALDVFSGSQGDPKELDGKTHLWTGQKSTYGNYYYYRARRGVDKGPGYQVLYVRSNRDAFEATARQICDSLEVVP
jgi:hypothetical protein